MATEPLVTIGLPVYNGEKLVSRAIDSVLAQTCPDVRLLISDNCSIDGTPDICRGYAEKDSRVVYTVTERNLGAAGNYTRTAQLARSRYFKWISHDDLISPDFVESCLAVAESDPSIITVAPVLEVVDHEGRVVQEVTSYTGRDGWPTDRLDQYRAMMRELAYCETHDDGLFMVAYEYGFHRLELLRRTRLELPFVSSDYVLAAELSLWGQLATIDRPLSTFTLGTSAAGTSANFTNWDPTAIQRMLDPSRTSRRDVLISVRRRHLEHVRAVLRSPLGVGDKFLAMSAATLPTRARLGVRLQSRFPRLAQAVAKGPGHA